MTLFSLSRRFARCALNGPRYSSNLSLHLVAELRKRTTVSIQKAREALLASGGDISRAVEWLENDRISTGQQKAEKVRGRLAGEGLICVSVLGHGTRGVNAQGVRAAMIEVNCETDFVARNEVFRKFAQDVTFTAAFLTDPQAASEWKEPFMRAIDHSQLQEAPIMVRAQGTENKQRTVSEATRDAIVALGEKINIRRATAFVHNPIPPSSGTGLRVSHYVHGALVAPANTTMSQSISETQGKIGALVAVGLKTSPPSHLRELLHRAEFNAALNTLDRALARQIVGMKPDHIRGDSEDALYNQPFEMHTASGGQSVRKFVSRWAKDQGMIRDSSQEGEDPDGLRVIEFSRWEVGEAIQ